MSVLAGFMVVLIRVTVMFWMVGFHLRDQGNSGLLFVQVALLYEVIMQVSYF